jgi:lipopolysaccharide transport system permease protein
MNREDLKLSFSSPSLTMLQTLTSHRHLLKQMVLRDLTVRFAGTTIGTVWSLVHPLILLGLYTLVFSYIYRVRLQQTEGVGFIPFIFCGLWPWMAFQEACLRSVSVIVDNAQLMKRVRFPSELLVISVILSTFLTQGIGFSFLLVGLAIWQGGIHLTSIGLLLVPFLLQLMLAVALGLLLATANVFLRDVSQLTSAAFNIWFFLTPVLYPISMVPETLRPLLAWNPLGSILALYRALILTPEHVTWKLALYPFFLALVLLALAQWVFGKCKGYFADHL